MDKLDSEIRKSLRDSLRDSRAVAVRDAEAFEGVIHAIERLGIILSKGITNLNGYEGCITQLAACSPRANTIARRWRDLHTPFGTLYELVRRGRNDAMHVGAFARHLTRHAVEL